MKKPTVFISYSHADSHFVDQLANKLKASGVDVWIDKWMIKVGNSITQKINEGIGASDFLIVILSHASVNSRWVREELNAATVRNIEQEKHAFILPVLLEQCEIPTLLQHRKYANFANDPERAFQELLEVIQPKESLPDEPGEKRSATIARPKELRKAILLILREHDKSGSAAYKEDTELAEELGQPVDEIQRQLDILEFEGSVTLAKAFGPSYGARITPRGLLYLEQIEEGSDADNSQWRF